MTPREIARQIFDCVSGGGTYQELNYEKAERIIQQAFDEEVARELDAHAEVNAQMVRDAVAQERERAALVCDAEAKRWNKEASRGDLARPTPHFLSCLARAEEADDLAKAIREQ